MAAAMMSVGRCFLAILKPKRGPGRLEKWSSGLQIRFAGSGSDSDDEVRRKARKEKEEDERKKLERTKEASQKLSQLLASIIKDSDKPKAAADVDFSLDLAKPKPRRKPKGEAVRKETKMYMDTIDPKLVTAAKDVSEAVPGEPKLTESELLQRLKFHAVETEEAKKEAAKPITLSNLFEGMQVEQPKASERITRKYGGKEMGPREFKQRDFRRQPGQGPREVSLFGSKPLGIFPADWVAKSESEPVTLKTWDRLKEREIQLSVTQPPAHGFEEMILLTEQGKLWQFPIDNEQGMDEEKKIGFHEHVFMEVHLEPWCPKSGPIRHFMELVCVALSKNPYLTVQRKKEFIEWFRKYFEDKKDILQEVMN